VTIQPGDVVLLRTGFVKWYVSAMEDASAKAMTSLAFAGLKAGEATERWLWNNRIAAVACDTVGLEGKVYTLPSPFVRRPWIYARLLTTLSIF
jgi:hypothetical protein